MTPKNLILKMTKYASVTLLATSVFVSCSTSSDSKANEQDLELCDRWFAKYGSEERVIVNFIENYEVREGTRAGFDAAIAAATSLEGLATLAAERTASLSKNGKDFFSDIETAFSEASTSIALKGGSIGPDQVELLNEVVVATETLKTFCNPPTE
jgi:hypothetical protein